MTAAFFMPTLSSAAAEAVWYRISVLMHGRVYHQFGSEGIGTTCRSHRAASHLLRSTALGGTCNFTGVRPAHVNFSPSVQN